MNPRYMILDSKCIIRKFENDWQINIDNKGTKIDIYCDRISTNGIDFNFHVKNHEIRPNTNEEVIISLYDTDDLGKKSGNIVQDSDIKRKNLEFYCSKACIENQILAIDRIIKEIEGAYEVEKGLSYKYLHKLTFEEKFTLDSIINRIGNPDDFFIEQEELDELARLYEKTRE